MVCICKSLFWFSKKSTQILHYGMMGMRMCWLSNNNLLMKNNETWATDGSNVKSQSACALETVQDFLIKLGIKPLMHLLEINIFSLNYVIVRLTKIMNNLLEHLKIRTFKVIFLCEKLVEYFKKKNSMKNIWLGDQLLLKNVFENFDF